MVVVDRHDRPGGHWNVAYPLVRRHQPSGARYSLMKVPATTPPSYEVADGVRCVPVGELPTVAVPHRPARPIFEPGRITLQWVRACQPTFSATMVAHIEATFEDIDEKNAVCRPIEPPTEPLDWLRMLAPELDNRAARTQHPSIEAFLIGNRLDLFAKTASERVGVDAEATEHITRYLTNGGPARERIDELLATTVA